LVICGFPETLNIHDDLFAVPLKDPWTGMNNPLHGGIRPDSVTHYGIILRRETIIHADFSNPVFFMCIDFSG
jgi:hypothetical protein